jgi:hypothetical protein
MLTVASLVFSCTKSRWISILYINSLGLLVRDVTFWCKTLPHSKFQPLLESSSIQPDGQFLNNCPSVCERKRAFCNVLLAMAWDQRRSERARSFWDFFSATREHFSLARDFLRFLGIFIFILAVVRGWFFPSLWFSFYDFCESMCLLLLVAAFCSFRLPVSKA